MAGANVMPGIAAFSGDWEGRSIDGFTLGTFLGGTQTSAVFLTSFDSRRAAIKLVPAVNAEAQLTRWTAAARLSHLNLIRIFTSGRASVDNVDLLYVVMEFAEENLGQVIPERTLSTEEARDVLDPALTALDYLHRKGFVHGGLKPSNILAVDDRLKLSTDNLYRTGEAVPEGVLSPATDVRALGVILEQALGAKARDLPEPFADIALNCLRPNPADRWTVPQIVDRLSHPEGSGPAPRRRRFPIPFGVLVLLGLVIFIVAGVMLKRNQPPPPAPIAAPVVTAQQKPPEPATPAPVEAPRKKSKKAAGPVEAANGQPMPEILPEATRSIRGKVIVTINVDTDSNGSVTGAALTGPNYSRYFSNQSLKAVRQWKFQQAEAAQRYQVRFEFLPTGTKTTQQRLAP